jgi:ATP-dependent Clp protease ATP-binding subunit ClpC
MLMFERLTLPARQAVVQAQEAARAVGHEQIGTEHLLIALAGDPAGIATKALTALGISQDTVRRQVLEASGVHPPAPDASIPFTPEVKKALELSLREALSLGHTHIGTGHLLLGLITQGAGGGVRVLTRLGVLDQVRQEVTTLLAADDAGGGGGEAMPPVVDQQSSPAPAVPAQAPARTGFLKRRRA